MIYPSKLNPWILMAFLIVFSCSSKQEKQSQLDSTNNISMPENAGILPAYLAIKDAFVKSDAKQVKQLAQKFIANNQNTDNKSILLAIAESISKEDDIDTQREGFEKLSENIYSMAKKDQLNGPTMYKQYCPMAFDNKGAFWLSDSEEIKNPYFGDKMLRCGRVTETIEMK